MRTNKYSNVPAIDEMLELEEIYESQVKHGCRKEMKAL